MTEHDIERLIQCVRCEHDPKDCGRTESDEDENGMCMDYVDRWREA